MARLRRQDSGHGEEGRMEARGIPQALSLRGREWPAPHRQGQARQAKYDKLIRFAEHLSDLRKVMSEHLEGEEFAPERTSALAVRLINLGWFRVGSERYAKKYRTFGITTLNKNHVEVRGSRVLRSWRIRRSRAAA